MQFDTVIVCLIYPCQVTNTNTINIKLKTQMRFLQNATAILFSFVIKATNFVSFRGATNEQTAIIIEDDTDDDANNFFIMSHASHHF